MSKQVILSNDIFLLLKVKKVEIISNVINVIFYSERFKYGVYITTSKYQCFLNIHNRALKVKDLRKGVEIYVNMNLDIKKVLTPIEGEKERKIYNKIFNDVFDIKEPKKVKAIKSILTEEEKKERKKLSDKLYNSKRKKKKLSNKKHV